MGYLGWMALVSAALLTIALTSAYIRHLPVTTSTLYLALGLVLGPLGLELISVDFVGQSVLFEHLTEIVVVVSLFVSGLKLRLPFRDPAWRAAYRLAGPVMVTTICGIAAFSHLFLGLPWPAAFLLGAVLAPTDPVLASTVSVDDAADEDRMRYGLTGEAGFNDGAAFPFVVFALGWMKAEPTAGSFAAWALQYIVWAVPAGLGIGYLLGKGLGRISIWLRSRHRDTEAPNDFLALALMGLAYVCAETVGAWGFLSAFAAGLGFRRAVTKTTSENPHPDVDRDGTPDDEEPTDHPPAEDLVPKKIEEEDIRHPAVAGGVVVSEVLSFSDTAERLLEILMVVLVGVCVGVYWDWRAVWLAMALFFVLRPAAVFLFLAGTPTGRYQRTMMAWFGIRGIGSVYYLSYAVTHGLKGNVSDLVGLTLSVAALSILLHGISSQPALSFYEEHIEGREKNDD